MSASILKKNKMRIIETTNKKKNTIGCVRNTRACKLLHFTVNLEISIIFLLFNFSDLDLGVFNRCTFYEKVIDINFYDIFLPCITTETAYR